MPFSQGLILDLDGALVDSNDARAEAWVEALAHVGQKLRFAQIRHLVGLVPNEILIRTTGFGLETPLGRSVYERYISIFRTRLLPRLIPFFGAVEFVERIKNSGLRMTVASCDPPEILLPLLRIAGAEALYHRSAMPSAMDLRSNRDLLRAAVEKLGASPPHVLMVADAPFDIEAAGQLNIPTVALESGGWARAELKGAAAIYENAAELLRDIETSPIATLVLQSRALGAA